ncbi:MAG: tripartite tricarboxylate transporter substrate binding protein [Burkholderiales bacterium]|jgi:tripartite-type tricarboxylate transporter receptor subunit TctC|nr:tripartite tricarboxylate transporter substrate binding protein [Burkholderiales bacterium]
MNALPRMHTLVRRAIVCGALLLGMGSAALAQAPYPSKPIRVVVPYPPGGATDIMARTVAQRLTEVLGQQVVIDNKAGGNSGIGAEIVAKAPADGYTLLFTNDATFVLNPVLFSSLPYDANKDFVPVATVAYLNLGLAVSSTLPVNSFSELVAYTRARSGKLSYGSYGVGSQAHLMGEMYKKISGTDLVHVPYKGSAQAVADVIGGQVLFTFPALTTVQGFLKADKVRMLAISGDKRSPLLPDVPTFAEVGYKDMDIGAWYAFLAPAGTPRDVVNRLNTAVAKLLGNREFIAQLVSQGMMPMTLSPEQISAQIRSETARMSRIVKASGARVD